MISIANKHTLQGVEDGDTYIGRGSPLGNPFPITKENPRDVVIASYGVWIAEQIQQGNVKVAQALHAIYHREMSGKNTRLICFCFPKACHGETIRRLVCKAVAGHRDTPGA